MGAEKCVQESTVYIVFLYIGNTECAMAGTSMADFHVPGGCGEVYNWMDTRVFRLVSFVKCI